MTNLCFLFACLLLGFILKKIKALPDNAAMTMNALIVNLFLPALTLRHAVNLNWDKNTLLPIASTWIVFAFSYLIFSFLGKKMNWERTTTGALIVVAGISSISFVGYPIFEILYGEKGLELGIAMSQSGTFLVCSTLGIATVSIFANSEKTSIDWKAIFKTIFTFPPFLAFCIALIIRLLEIEYSPIFVEILTKLGAPFSCIALLSIGFQMNFKIEKKELKPLLYGLVFKLLFAPILIYSLFFLGLKENGLGAKISVLGSALGSMNTIGIVAIRQGLNEKLILQLLAISIPLSLILLPIFYFVVK
jgi:predicted permease